MKLTDLFRILPKHRMHKKKKLYRLLWTLSAEASWHFSIQQEMCAFQRKKIYRAQWRNELRYIHSEAFHLVESQFDLWCWQRNFKREMSRSVHAYSCVRLSLWYLRCKTEILCFSRPLTQAESCKMSKSTISKRKKKIQVKPMKSTFLLSHCDLWCST